MRKFLSLISILVLYFLFFEEVFALSEKDGKTILIMHNEVRSGLNLSSLQWDKKIALEAQKWADVLSQKDIFRHSESIVRGGRGENLYMIASSGKPLLSSGEDAMNAWLNESKNYTYTTNTCAPGKVCGHFTQIVWGTTKKIGCGKAIRKYTKTTKIYWVCQYDPPGNYTGQKPF